MPVLESLFNLKKERLQHGCFFKYSDILTSNFFYRTPPVAASVLGYTNLIPLSSKIVELHTHYSNFLEEVLFPELREKV